jgi:F-type H+-transporting ATPase subunit epsilon
VVTVLTAAAREAAEVTPDLAERAAAEAEALPAGTAVERANKAKARERAAGMRKVAGRNAAAGVGTATIVSPGSSPTA